MRIMLTGAGGQLGHALCRAQPSGEDIIALDRAGLDVGDAAAVTAMMETLRPDLIVNAAAYTAVDRAEQELELAERINHQGVRYLANAARAIGARLVQVSTDFVFDGASTRPYRIDDLPRPLSVYGRTKWAGEHAALSAPGSLIVRTSWLYGVQGTNFVKTMLRLMAERDEVRVVADQIGTPTHADSLARAIWALAMRGASGIAHVSDAGVASWYDFAVAIQEEAYAIGLLDRMIPVLPIATSNYPTPATRPALSVLDRDATWVQLGKPAAHWRVELRLMLAQLKDMTCG
ncbi:dTDP-4-dehydrorhamnose reductase [Aquisediminimonas sediminicola]|uniref:dTDP-4-dehydrorhamnose reductase n=1 Tax=Alteraquisediminimonas sediminicola TaxID=2676787 RepID=UPI001C8EB698|nr:dTDP-4-dehydrorhamnose reductase [Aquisediminimonas sediminicola]